MSEVKPLSEEELTLWLNRANREETIKRLKELFAELKTVADEWESADCAGGWWNDVEKLFGPLVRK